MKKLLCIGLLLVAGCTTSRERLAAKIVPKTATVEVKTIIRELVLTFGRNGFDIHAATVPVTVYGAGVKISPYGHILTCAHLFSVGPCGTTTVIMSDQHGYPAEVLYKDPLVDLALVHINVPTPNFVQLTKHALRVGQDVMAVGTPRILPFTVTHGIISYIGRTFTGESAILTQTDTPINPGNSGGPLFDTDGNLAGIVNARMGDSDGLGFAIPPETIKKFLDTFKGL